MAIAGEMTRPRGPCTMMPGRMTAKVSPVTGLVKVEPGAVVGKSAVFGTGDATSATFDVLSGKSGFVVEPA